MEADDKRLNLSDINKFYRYKLYEVGLATKSGIINRAMLFYKFKEFYPKNYLLLMKSSLDDNNIEESWIYYFFFLISIINQ